MREYFTLSVRTWKTKKFTFIMFLDRIGYLKLSRGERYNCCLLDDTVYSPRPGVAEWLRRCATSRIDSRWCHWIFQWRISFRPHHGPGVDLAPSENEYQEYFLGIKAAGAWGWRPHHLHVSNVMKIWEPKPPGTLWTTPGLLRDDFTFTLPYILLRGKQRFGGNSSLNHLLWRWN
jgi:hypothetical protein